MRLLEVQRGKWVLQLPLHNFDQQFRDIVETILIEYPKKSVHDKFTKKVLTTVAFHQPLSKPKLFKVISAEEKEITIQKLEKHLDVLIQEGLVRSNVSGRPILYRTTAAFANEFGLDPVRSKLKQQLIKRLDKSKK